jgi:hypothetical protein
VTTAAQLFEIGDRLIYNGRVCRIHGFTPMSVEPARIYLAAQDGALLVPVAIADLAPVQPERAAA